MSDDLATVAPARLGVLGGGRMGAGIAHAFLLAGSRVHIVERDADSVAAASSRVLQSVERSLEREATSRSEGALRAAFSVGTDIAGFADADLVIEAVPEDRNLKADALARAEAAISETATLASNTSSISINDLAGALSRPAQFLGLHFFNPVPTSALVEVVVGTATNPALIEAARGWVTAIEKTPVVVRDSPGFASSRLGVALGLEAIRMVEEGVASAADIDAAMVLGYKHPVGPLQTTDIVGLDVRLGIAEELHRALGVRFEPPELLRQMVTEGKLGRKSGEGFYVWENN
ncbi:3-hydroxybutyryl-CoA dehydrogenase [Microbacterium sp. CH12i]|uniref:3-hydroxyacyl-CoA dehydrogenase family protein n=1 Tax=Microbacterium sp. CH12i TaxID=1479651 RepID=UPI000460EB05|nr:3-hydroxyacyl-CoA dehydrogenase family protein [Microbacterium sp. CH12i]KDA06577.1 3-hydroxybutyryl-CoA dehydrogenase [Microbacterium sp. CH12i]